MVVPTTPPIGEMLSRFAGAIAESQRALDDVSIRTAQEMGSIDNGAAFTDGRGRKYSLLDLGFVPAFYQFTEARFQIRLAVSSSFSEEKSVRTSKKKLTLGWGGIGAKTVNAGYASKFQYRAESSSQIISRLVARPAPEVLERRIRALTEEASV